MDQLSLDTLPYYESQLSAALKLIQELEQKLPKSPDKQYDLIVRKHEGLIDYYSYQCVEDLPDTTEQEEVIMEVADQYESELGELDNVNLDLEMEVINCTQKLDQLNEQLTSIQQQNLILEQQINTDKQLLLERQQVLSELVDNMGNVRF